MCLTAVLPILAGFAHFSAARVLPATLKVVAASLGWLITTTAVSSRFPSANLVVLLILGLVSTVALSQAGFSCYLAQRCLYFPLVGGVLGTFVASMLRKGGFQVGTALTVLVIGQQLWSSLGGVVMLAVYPASVLQAAEYPRMREARFENAAYTLTTNMNKSVERFFTKSLNGIQLDTAVVKDRRNLTKQWMMYFGGNAEFMENTIADVTREADMFNANLILFNPRGIGRSNGYVSQVSDLVEDAAAVAQSVVKKEHINPRNLLLFGHSIGGGVAAQLAYRVFPEATLVLDRTFSSLSDAASSFSPFTPAVTQRVFPLLVGDFNNVEAWNGIQHDRRLILFSRNDEIIRYEASSIARLPQFQRGQPNSRYVIELRGPHHNCHNVAITDFDERDQISTFGKRALGA